MDTSMPREARKWLSVLDDLLDTEKAKAMVCASKGGGGPRSGMCYIASRVAYELLSTHHTERYTPMCSSGVWGTHWFLRNAVSKTLVDLTGCQYSPELLRDIYISPKARAQGFVPTRAGSTWSSSSLELFRMVEARHRVLYPTVLRRYHYGADKKPTCGVYK